VLASFPRLAHPTFFEVTTVLALQHFAAQGCELVIWETGLGGRLDATNIVTPLASVITNVSLEHQRWLGTSIEQIATEKAGIIKDDVPVITGAEPGPALEVIRRTATERHAPLTVADTVNGGWGMCFERELPLKGAHQRRNAALACATVRVLQAQIPVSEESVRVGLKATRWPGRFQVFERRPGQTIVLDGAHNPTGAESLRATWETEFPGQRATVLLGILEDKELDRICEALMPLAARVFVVPVESARSASPKQVAEICRRCAPPIDVRDCGSLAEAMKATADDPTVLVTGSLYLVGAALEQLTSQGLSERALNEWGKMR